MIIGNQASTLRLAFWQWKFVLLSTAAATAVTLAHTVLEVSWLTLPTLPLAVVGAALGIFVSFRTNSCYDRWWEGRKLWGRLINTSRHMAIQIHRYVGHDHPEDAQRMVRRHIAYTHTLRCLLRGQDPHEDDDVVKYLSDEELPDYLGSSNMTARLLDRQMRDFLELNLHHVRDGAHTMNDFRLSDLDESVRHLFDIQGGCERIKKTPLPRIYGFIAERMIQAFALMFPLALVSDLGWWTIPVSVLVTFCFKMISETGRILEDPFNLFWNALPLHALSRTIEINLLELVGETTLPEPIQPINRGRVLM